jgi:3',5'-cyclic AMP phosphodiesterase CpdA
MTNGHRDATSRRRFLKGTLAAAGAVAMLGPRRILGGASKDAGTARWAFLSDTHIPANPEDNYRGFYPYRNLRKVVGQISADLPEGLVITGDLARLEGLAGDYVNARKLLSPIVEHRPVCVGLGNHDNRANFLEVFREPGGNKQPVKGKHVVVVETGPVRLIVLDSLLYVNKVAGLLGRSQRIWLEQTLGRGGGKPTILFFHHTLGDGDGDLLDVPRLFDLIKPASQVKALVFGHSHVYSYSEFEGIHLINLPASGYNFGDAQPVGWVDAKLTAEGGHFTLRTVGGNTRGDGSVRELRWRS